ncbi:DoxX family protein [Myroides sp. 1354]|uniref:DoxX family protein n=1 Tax=unclassified Myroides TaxID=2642485 RepID=UPI002576EF5B|nr:MULTISPECIES: DoxX family protein [unclassified Myroides]MDM1046250.1 DoxX family protein [Myroides sp. R163-1]MDM1057186.1 DoxX family protein [Myroides sp. 1354]MDM1070381.1 DoxX family protein [Myroides sp. 1372]
MNKKIIYWISTSLFSLFMLFSAYSYFTDPTFKEAFVYLGYPDYFRVELGIAKILGVLALLLPFLPRVIKGFAYAGFTINIVAAAIAHLAVGEGISSLVPMLIAGVLLALSYYFLPLSLNTSTTSKS